MCLKRKIKSYCKNHEHDILNEIVKGEKFDFEQFDPEGMTIVNSVDDIPNKLPGVYFFVATRDISFTIREAFEQFIQISVKDLKLHLMCSPKLNVYKLNHFDETYTIKKNEVIYIGRAKELKTRYDSHMSDKIDKTNSMKFGLRKNIFIFEGENRNCDYYIITCDDYKQKEVAFKKKFKCHFGD